MRIYLLAGAALALAGSAAAQTPPPAAAQYIMMAGQSDQFEIQTGKLASTKGTGEVKAFGRKMVTDHTKSTAMIVAAAKRSRMKPGPPPALNPDQQAMLTELQGLKGDAFDKDYITQQTTAHEQALALQSGYAKDGDDKNLKKAAAQIVPVVKMHIKMLEKMH